MMLAARGTVADIERLQGLGYLFDLKVDGVRCLAEVKGGKVRLTSRAGAPMTSKYPEIVTALQGAFSGTDVVLDGEIAVNDDRGLPSWPLTHKRDSQHSRPAGWAETLPACFYAFDVLEITGTDMRRWAYTNRLQVLNEEVKKWHPSPTLKVVPNTSDGEHLWGMVTELELEGVIAKRPGARYREGRSRDWIKVKRTSTVSCLVGGFDPGEGSRASTFGALHLYLLNEAETLVPVGKVGSGFSDSELLKVMQALHHPPVIVEVKYLDVSPDGQLRQPVFLGLRTDITMNDCTTKQLTT